MNKWSDGFLNLACNPWRLKHADILWTKQILFKFVSATGLEFFAAEGRLHPMLCSESQIPTHVLVDTERFPPTHKRPHTQEFDTHKNFPHTHKNTK